MIANSDFIYLFKSPMMSYCCAPRVILLFVLSLILYGCIFVRILCPSIGSAAPCTDQLRTAPPLLPFLLPVLLLLSPKALQLKSSRIPQSQQA